MLQNPAFHWRYNSIFFSLHIHSYTRFFFFPSKKKIPHQIKKRYTYYSCTTFCDFKQFMFVGNWLVNYLLQLSIFCLIKTPVSTEFKSKKFLHNLHDFVWTITTERRKYVKKPYLVFDGYTQKTILTDITLCGRVMEKWMSLKTQKFCMRCWWWEILRNRFHKMSFWN